MMKALSRLILTLCACLAAAAPAAAGRYENFEVAIYIVVGTTQQLADPATLARQYERIASQLKFDKVYIETYRDHRFADERSLPAIKQFFTDRGIKVAGGVTLAAGGQGGQFGTFDYEDTRDREECRKAVEMAARHFDEVILDDFFFYTTKSDADIAAKGQRSWTQYRLEKMREVARDLVIGPARAVNPRVKLVIKYPNWYEHFQALGYDLEIEPRMFDYIYTGTETRDPIITDQLLQQYQSYLTFRYLANIRRDGGNRGGWVDTFSTRYVDRYAEQLWDTLFAKAPEITLFNWVPLASPEPVAPGERAAWQSLPTAFDWDEMVGSYRAPPGQNAAPGWARAAGYALEQVDTFLGRLGKPIGIASYKPYHSSGEDYLHAYLGNIGLPIELYPHFPADAEIVLLTESARYDPQIVAKMKRHLESGRRVVVTSGLLRALQGKGIEDIVELEHTGRTVAIREYYDAYGAGNGTRLDDPAREEPAILFPEIRFYTNDSWTLVRGVASAKGFPILLMNRYSRGIFYLLTIPENMGDLYALPQGVLDSIRRHVQGDFPVRIDAPSHVSLFAYDNGTFIIQSFRDDTATVSVSVAGANRKLHDIVSGRPVAPTVTASATDDRRRRAPEPPRTNFTVEVPPHSYVVFAAQ